MRIAFDGTTIRPGRTGVGYYSEHLLHHLAQQYPDDELIVISNRLVDTTRSLPRAARVETSSWRAPCTIWMQALAPRTLRRLAPDVAHFTNGMVPLASPVPTVVTIHDMSLTLFPKYHPARRVVLNRPLVDLAAMRADAIITVSQSAKRDILDLYGVPANRVHVVHEAAAPVFTPVLDRERLLRVRQRYGLSDRVILYVGTIEPRKNLPTLIDAFAQRRRKGGLPHQLVCVGPYGWLSGAVGRQVEHLALERAIRFTGYVPLEDLPALYSLAEFFVFPSLYEGFGLPVVEAMACGTPVITGRVAALAEIAGGAVVHVERLDAESIGEAIAGLARDLDWREQLRSLGLARARAFSWAQAARETFKVYRHAVENRAPVPSPVRAAYQSGAR